MYVPITTFNIGYPRERPWKRLPQYYSTDLRKSKRKFQLFSCHFYTNCTMEFYLKLIFIQFYVSSRDTLCYIPLLFHAFPFVLRVFAELRPTYYTTASSKRKPRSSRLLDKPAAGQCGRCRICHGKYRGDRILCPDHFHLYVRWLEESLPPRPHTGLCLPETQPCRLAVEVLPTVPVQVQD